MEDADGQIAVRVLRTLEAQCLAFSNGDLRRQPFEA
jgi:MarR family transcriptional regulator for hemolysin